MKITEYTLCFFGKNEDSIPLTMEQGEKLKMVLISPSCPRFVLVDGMAINVSSIKGVYLKKKMVNKLDNRGIPQLEQEDRLLTESEKRVHQMYVSLKGKLFENVKMLSNKERTDIQEQRD